MRSIVWLSFLLIGCASKTTELKQTDNNPVNVIPNNIPSQEHNKDLLDTSEYSGISYTSLVPHCGDVDQPKCQLGQGCRAHSDCASEACAYSGKCVAEKSCISHFGGDTCGTGEVGDPNAKHESCCLTDTLPNGVKMDRYLMTAGRARTIVDSVKGNFKDWYTNNRNSLRPETTAQIDPFVNTLPGDMRFGDYSVVAQVNGGNIYIKDLPSTEQGCYEAPGAAGTHTYWLSPSDNAIYGDTNGFSQDVLDAKPLNCAPYIFFAALCAVDGGRLQTFEEAQLAYGTAIYPWGDTPAVGGFGPTGLVQGPANIGPWGPLDPVCANCDTTLMNWLNNYQFPVSDPKISFDYSYFISAPGRFPKDKGPYGHYDVGGNLIAWTASIVENYADAQGRSPYIRLTGNGSWEGHQADYWKWGMPPLTKYSKFSGRCVKY